MQWCARRGGVNGGRSSTRRPQHDQLHGGPRREWPRWCELPGRCELPGWCEWPRWNSKADGLRPRACREAEAHASSDGERPASQPYPRARTHAPFTPLRVAVQSHARPRAPPAPPHWRDACGLIGCGAVGSRRLGRLRGKRRLAEREGREAAGEGARHAQAVGQRDVDPRDEPRHYLG